MSAFKKYRGLFTKSLFNNEQLAAAISKVLIKMRDVFVAFFDRIYNRLNPSSQKFSLILFCLLTGGLSLYQVLRAFQIDDNTTGRERSTKVVPRYFKDVDKLDVQKTIVTEAEHNRLTAFELYMDSLRKNKNGYVIYDSILQARPGLMDSVQELHYLYESQLKKEK